MSKDKTTITDLLNAIDRTIKILTPPVSPDRHGESAAHAATTGFQIRIQRSYNAKRLINEALALHRKGSPGRKSPLANDVLLSLQLADDDIQDAHRLAVTPSAKSALTKSRKRLKAMRDAVVFGQATRSTFQSYL